MRERSIEKRRMEGGGYVGRRTRSSRAGVEDGRVLVGGCRDSRRREKSGVVGESGGASGGVSRGGGSFGHVRCWASCAVCSSRCWQRARSRYRDRQGRQGRQGRRETWLKEVMAEGARRRVHSQLGG